MLNYIKEILPRIKKYSKSIDKIEEFVDKPWRAYTDTDDIEEYEFDRNGRLLISSNGIVTEGSWELRKSIDRILVEVDHVKYNMEYNFINKQFLVLKIANSTSTPQFFYNRHLITKRELITFLGTLIDNKPALNRDTVRNINRTVTPVNRDSNKAYVTDKGVIIINHVYPSEICLGDQVSKSGSIAPDGVYNILGNSRYVNVEIISGKIFSINEY